MMDSLFTTRIVFYRARPGQDAINILDELDALRATPEPTDEQSERLATLGAEQIMVSEYKFTVGSISVLAGNRRSANLRTARAWIEENCGVSITDHLNVAEEDRPDDWYSTLQFMNAASSWATIIVSIRSIEQRQVDIIGDTKSAWEPTPMPEAWATVGGFLDSIDPELLLALTTKISELNPGTLLLGGDDTNRKKFGVVNGH